MDYSSKKGPLLFAQFDCSSSAVEKVSLSLSDEFIVSIKGPFSPALKTKILSWINQYLSKSKSPDLPVLQLEALSPFQNSILSTLLKVPFGQTLSYQTLAQNANYAKACRAVGSACKNNPIPFMIPCHRVILGNDQIGQFNAGIEIKKRLLSFEGAFYKP
jgi:O-6-methylguanine DNA methyltransferase